MKQTKTEAGTRSVELDPATVKVLRDHRRAQAECRLAVGPGWRDSAGLIFTEVDGAELHPGRLSELWRILVKAKAPSAKVLVIRLHDLRHSHAMAAGVRPDIVAKRLSHSSVVFTLSTNAHVYEGHQREALERMLGPSR